MKSFPRSDCSLKVLQQRALLQQFVDGVMEKKRDVQERVGEEQEDTAETAAQTTTQMEIYTARMKRQLS